ncbi:MAG: hypothetical protein H7X85_04565 [Thermoanaerobaculia bacterium]|nr:hypothetical protein [Thermoanaerobaculia bacterium]
MKKAVALALAVPRPAPSAAWVLGVEAVAAAFLLLSDGVPAALIRGLQLFLRF